MYCYLLDVEGAVLGVVHFLPSVGQLLAAAIAHRDMAWRLVAVAVNYSLAAAAVAGRIHLLAHLNAH